MKVVDAFWKNRTYRKFDIAGQTDKYKAGRLCLLYLSFNWTVLVEPHAVSNTVGCLNLGDTLKQQEIQVK